MVKEKIYKFKLKWDYYLKKKKALLKLKLIAKGSRIKVTQKGTIGHVRFKGNGKNIIRQLTDNVNIAPETQLRAMITVADIEAKLIKRKFKRRI